LPGLRITVRARAVANFEIHERNVVSPK